jgi:hypothetical protein
MRFFESRPRSSRTLKRASVCSLLFCHLREPERRVDLVDGPHGTCRSRIRIVVTELPPRQTAFVGASQTPTFRPLTREEEVVGARRIRPQQRTGL